MKKYSSVLFDLDGTLLDTSEGILSSVSYTIKEMNFPEISEKVMKSFIGPPIQNSFKRVYNLDDETTTEAARVFRQRYSTVDLNRAKLYDEVIDLLKFLKDNHYKVGVATYKREDYAKKILDDFGISKYCDCIYGADFQGKYTKQDIINLCINEIEKDKSKVLMIGDTDHDKIGAEQANVDFLAVTYGFGYSKDNVNNCEKVCNTVMEIKNFI